MNERMEEIARDPEEFLTLTLDIKFVITEVAFQASVAKECIKRTRSFSPHFKNLHNVAFNNSFV